MLTALKHWPKDGCVRLGWAKTAEGWPPDSNRSAGYNSADAWTLGISERFFVLINDFFGTRTGVAKSMADVWLKMPGHPFRYVEEVELLNPNDILGVVEALQKLYADGDSAEAREWRSCMSDFDEELQAALKAENSYEADEDREYCKVPHYLRDVVNDWRYTKVNDETPDELLEAFIRLERSWTAYSSCILMNQFGDVFNEELVRSDRIGCLLDRMIRKTKDIDRMTRVMNLYRMMMPCYIGTEGEKSNVEYEKSWDKVVAHKIVDDPSPLTADRVQLLLRVRHDNKRLPTPISKFIKQEIPKYLEMERMRLDASSLYDTTHVMREIQWLANYRDARFAMGKDIKDMSAKVKEVRKNVERMMENEDDLRALDTYSLMLTSKFDMDSTSNERECICKRMEKRLKGMVRTTDTQPAKAMAGEEKAVKALAEEFTLAAILLENLYMKKDEQDIDTYYWNLHEQNVWEEKMEKENGAGYDFFIW